MTFSEILSEAINSVEGIVAISLTGLDGIGVQTLSSEQGDESFDAEAIEVELAGLTNYANKTLTSLAGGAVKEIIIEGENRSYFGSQIDSNYFLFLILGAGGNLGRARMETRRISQKLRDNL